MAKSDARLNFGDEHYERRWQRMVQTRLRLDRDAAAARKDLYAIQNERLCMEAEQVAQQKRSQSDRIFPQALREKAKERDRAYQDALLAYKQRLGLAAEIAPPPARPLSLDLVYQTAPDMTAVRGYMAAGAGSCRPWPEQV